MTLVTPSGHGLGYRKRDGRLQYPTLVTPALPAGALLPAMVDMRHQFLPARNQGPYGTCTGQGASEQVEHALLRQHINVPYHRSALYPYYFAGLVEGNTGDVGRDPHDVIDAIAQHGIPPEKDWPYDPTLIGVAPSAAAQHAADRRHIVASYEVPVTIDAVMAALASGYAVGIAVPIYSSFETAQVETTGIVPLPSVGDVFYGGHWMVIGGYTTIPVPDVPANYLMVLNSWGAGFGKQGWVFLPFSWIGGIGPDGQALTEELIAVELITP